MCPNCKRIVTPESQVSDKLHVCVYCKAILIEIDQRLTKASDQEIEELFKDPELLKMIAKIKSNNPFPNFIFSDNVPTLPGAKFVICLKKQPLMIFSVNRGNYLDFFAVLPGQSTPTAEEIEKIKNKAQHWYFHSIIRK